MYIDQAYIYAFDLAQVCMQFSVLFLYYHYHKVELYYTL